MPSAIDAAMVVVVDTEAGVTVVEAAVTAAMVERAEVLEVDTRRLIGTSFSQETRLKSTDMSSSAGVKQPAPNNSQSR